MTWGVFQELGDTPLCDTKEYGLKRMTEGVGGSESGQIFMTFSNLHSIFCQIFKKICQLYFKIVDNKFSINSPREHKRVTYDSIQNFGIWQALVLTFTGFIGGMFTGVTGSGTDICSFAILSLLFR